MELEIAIVALLFTNIILLLVLVVEIVENNKSKNMWHEYAQDRDHANKEMMEWLARNLKEYGSFDSDPNNSNVIRFHRRV